jgi:acetoin utilization protein AcuC
MAQATRTPVAVVAGEKIARYGFPEGHPFGPDRHDAFMRELKSETLDQAVTLLEPRSATREEIESFHSPAYVDLVIERSASGQGYLDAGDTPAFRGVYEAAANVVGATLTALEGIMSKQFERAFIPIAGLHHASRGHAAGFCVFNDCGVAAEILRRRYGLERIGYIDIDAHHGDGVFYAFEEDPHLLFADIHEDGRFLYPGTGAASETGAGAAKGTKLNLPMPPGATDEHFLVAWEEIEAYLRATRPQFILFQCGADSLEGDPITHMRFTENAHGHAAARLCELAREFAEGRVLAMGGGGYNRRNLARAWTRVVRSLVEAP